MQDDALHLLIVHDSAAEAELITNVLRNAGMAVRADRVQDDDGLKEALDKQQWDIIVSAGKMPDFSGLQTLEALKQIEKDVPVIILANGQDDFSIVDALSAGARDLVRKDQLDHFHLVVKRECDNARDRRAHRLCRKEYRESERRCQSLLENSQDAITYVHEGMHINANPIYLDLFGYADEEEIEGMPIMDMVTPDEQTKFKEFLRGLNKTGADPHAELEVRGIRTDGVEFDALMEFSPATIDGEACTQIIIRQQSNNKELEKQLKAMSQQDLLTGLYNRQYFLEQLESTVSRAATNKTPSALLYVELDEFNNVKEDIGIASGDLVLGDIANILNEKFSTPHIPARFDGHIFTILVNEKDIKQAAAMAEVLRKTIEDHISEVSKKSITVTCSIGISPITENMENAQDALSRADGSCEIAKNEGGNKIHIHNPAEEDEKNLQASGKWGEKIKHALENDRFMLVFQPIVSLHGDANENYEVLLRMQEEGDTLIDPMEFIPTAEKSGMMRDVDRWVIKNAAKKLAASRSQGKNTFFFIKLSVDSLIDKTLLPWISETIKNERIAGDAIAFEITEAVAMTHLTQAKALTNGLKQLRCNVVLEHFGSGLNSFKALKHLSVDYLKIDGSLIESLASEEESQVTVKSITEMAHSSGKLTIAEYVQDANSLAVLWQCGINYIQGYFLREPTPELDYDFTSEH